jgi:aminopeptidase 2
VLDSREMDIELDTSKPFKLNAGTVTPGKLIGGWHEVYSQISIVRVLYSPERFIKIAAEAAKGENVFSIDDRIGLVSDAAALAGAGFAKTSAALEMIHQLRNEPHRVYFILSLGSQKADDSIELVWTAFSGFMGETKGTWFENKAVYDGMSKFSRVNYIIMLATCTSRC